MSFILWFSAVLVGLSALGATFIVARSARRRWKQNRLEGQAERVRALLEGARKDRYDELDKLLFELRANYDPWSSARAPRTRCAATRPTS